MGAINEQFASDLKEREKLFAEAELLQLKISDLNQEEKAPKKEPKKEPKKTTTTRTLTGATDTATAEDAERLRKAHESILGGLKDEVFQLDLRARLVGKNVKEAAELFAMEQAINDAIREGIDLEKINEKTGKTKREEIEELAVTIGETAQVLRETLDADRLLEGISDDITGPFKDALKEGELSFKSFAKTLVNVAERLRSRLVDEIFKDIEDALIKALRGGDSGGGGILGTLLSIGGSALGSLAGSGSGAFAGSAGSSNFSGGGGSVTGTSPFDSFAHGGSFTVGCSPGIDNNLVAFNASRGERVEITPAGQSAGGGDTIIHQTIDARGAVEGVPAQIQRALDANNRQLPGIIRDAQRRSK